jgi:hypothetical protein
VAKFIPAISMKTTVMPSISGEFQNPKLASWLEKPPRPMVVNACMTASNQLMPAQCSEKMQATVTTP